MPTMTNKSVMTFISVNKISVCLSVRQYKMIQILLRVVLQMGPFIDSRHSDVEVITNNHNCSP